MLKHSVLFTSLPPPLFCECCWGRGGGGGGSAVSYVRLWGERGGWWCKPLCYGWRGRRKEGGSWEFLWGALLLPLTKPTECPKNCFLRVLARAVGRPIDPPCAQKQDRREEEEEEEGRKFINATCSWFFGVGSWAAMLRVFFRRGCQVGVSNRENWKWGNLFPDGLQ